MFWIHIHFVIRNLDIRNLVPVPSIQGSVQICSTHNPDKYKEPILFLIRSLSKMRGGIVLAQKSLTYLHLKMSCLEDKAVYGLRLFIQCW
jgi:hypothetical protein